MRTHNKKAKCKIFKILFQTFLVSINPEHQNPASCGFRNCGSVFRIVSDNLLGLGFRTRLGGRGYTFIGLSGFRVSGLRV